MSNYTKYSYHYLANPKTTIVQSSQQAYMIIQGKTKNMSSQKRSNSRNKIHTKLYSRPTLSILQKDSRCKDRTERKKKQYFYGDKLAFASMGKPNKVKKYQKSIQKSRDKYHYSRQQDQQQNYIINHQRNKSKCNNIYTEPIEETAYDQDVYVTIQKKHKSKKQKNRRRRYEGNHQSDRDRSNATSKSKHMVQKTRKNGNQYLSREQNSISSQQQYDRQPITHKSQNKSSCKQNIQQEMSPRDHTYSFRKPVCPVNCNYDRRIQSQNKQLRAQNRCLQQYVQVLQNKCLSNTRKYIQSIETGLGANNKNNKNDHEYMVKVNNFGCRSTKNNNNNNAQALNSRRSKIRLIDDNDNKENYTNNNNYQIKKMRSNSSVYRQSKDNFMNLNSNMGSNLLQNTFSRCQPSNMYNNSTANNFMQDNMIESSVSYNNYIKSRMLSTNAQ